MTKPVAVSRLRELLASLQTSATRVVQLYGANTDVGKTLVSVGLRMNWMRRHVTDATISGVFATSALQRRAKTCKNRGERRIERRTATSSIQTQESGACKYPKVESYH